MKKDKPYDSHLYQCLKIRFLGFFDQTMVKLKLRKKRKQLTCHEFEDLIQLIIDKESSIEDKELFKVQYKLCKGCCRKYFQEKAWIEQIRQTTTCEKAPKDLTALIRSAIVTS